MGWLLLFLASLVTPVSAKELAWGHEMVTDSENASFTSWAPIALDAPIVGARALGASCTVGGNVSVADANGNLFTWLVAPGFQFTPVSPDHVASSGMTATCVFFNMQ